jgi:uncharacterized membrane protein
MSQLHLYFGPDAETAPVELRKIGIRDCFAALREGFEDFRAMPSYLAFVGAFYAAAGVALASFTSFASGLQLVFPLASGFALIGPFIALGLYEMSRRRENGQSLDWRDSFVVLRSPALPAIVALGLILCALFVAWIAIAQGLYVWFYGPNPPSSATDFLRDVTTSERGRLLFAVGGLVGFGFAVLTLCIGVVSFPLLLDRDIGLIPAIGASLRTARQNPVAVATWGLIVAAALILGTLPVFLGLVFVLPVLGHASWRFYRRAIVRDPAHEHPAQWPIESYRRPASYYANPHPVIFPLPQREERDSRAA